MNRVSFLLVFLLCGLACQEDEEQMPTNLNLEFTISENGSGDVSVHATADNANFYTVTFGDFGSEAVTTTDGHATHTYTASGTYTVYVRAHRTEDKFISASKMIEVDVTLVIPTEGYQTPLTYDGMTMVWQDEFSGTAIDENFWTFEIGTGSSGWGNNELEYYLKENAMVQDGHLIITAKKDGRFGTQYTSTRMITRDKKSIKYGRVDVRALLPEGQGIWPAIWMLGNSISTVGWPKCGEIDIMEMIGGQGRENTVHGTAHWFGNVYASNGNDHTLSSGTFKDKFHVFSVVWDEQYIRWYMDDVQFHVLDITPDALSEFHENFFFIMNVAVGGNWPGSPNSSTVFPQHMIVDYIRVFQN
jgi:hypothetical protein